MTRNQTGINNSKTGEISKVLDDNTSKALSPYYWSWYGFIFPPRNYLAGELRAVTVKEKL
jgi:hypothetical protein